MTETWGISRLASPDYAPQFGVHAEGEPRDFAIVKDAGRAALVKAAPALLGACRAMVRELDEGDNFEDWEAAKEKLRAAISLATEGVE